MSKLTFLVIGTLPPPVLQVYGFRPAPWRRRLAAAVLAAIKRIRPLLPAKVRLTREAKAALRRLGPREPPQTDPPPPAADHR